MLTQRGPLQLLLPEGLGFGLFCFHEVNLTTPFLRDVAAREIVVRVIAGYDSEKLSFHCHRLTPR
jgi:hypothetical protein